MESYQWMYAAGVIDGHASHPCEVSEANDTFAGYGIKFIISKCDLDSPIQVTITTAMEDKNIIGGMGAVGFEIKCNGILEGGENVTLVQTVLSKDKEFGMRHQEKADQKMVIRAKNGTMLLDRSIVLIGDELSVLISTSGNFWFSVVSCEAQGENHKDKKLLINNGIAVDPSLMTIFNQSKHDMRSNAEAKLFAFHFVNSDYLELTCVINVCRNSDKTCKPRTKRNAPNTAYTNTTATESLAVNIVVVDGEGNRSFGTSGAKSYSGPSIASVVFLALALLTYVC
ncbi:hypothetical protein ACJMK2_026709 [Sinanodonta woodiana]|uniref:ZP domain-containing protein n=1 Tax=Sinanodonta woodiana TaxID=1069815 RepID=A0ABD3XKM3_SINWO